MPCWPPQRAGRPHTLARRGASGVAHAEAGTCGAWATPARPIRELERGAPARRACSPRTHASRARARAGAVRSWTRGRAVEVREQMLEEILSLYEPEPLAEREAAP
jgi:hypothetical protein